MSTGYLVDRFAFWVSREGKADPFLRILEGSLLPAPSVLFLLFFRVKEKCYPDIPNPYKSSILSLIKSKVNVGVFYVYNAHEGLI